MAKQAQSQGKTGENQTLADTIEGEKIPVSDEATAAAGDLGTAGGFQTDSSPGQEPVQEAAESTGEETDQPSSEPIGLEEKCTLLEAQLADMNNQYLRKAADFENFRKRLMREKQELTEFANQNLLLDLLPVIDDFERAIQSAQGSAELAALPAGKAILDGIAMIEKRLVSDLENKWGLKRFDSAGQPFDPNRHEALQMEKAAGIEEAVVSEDYVKGYTLKDRVIRCAKVKVLMPED